MLKIASSQNATFKKLLSLTSSKGLRKERLFLLSGEKLVREYLAGPAPSIVYEITLPRRAPLSGGVAVELPSALFAQLDVLGTNFNLLVLEQPEIPVLSARNLAAHKPDGIELVIPIGDPGNLGALIRSCEAFGVRRAILTREAAHPFLPKAVKASAGSVLRVLLMEGPSLSEFPEDCIALDTEGAALGDFSWPASGLLAIGEEGAGFGARKFKRRVRVLTQGVESLNVVVAASIALAHRAGLK